MADILQKLKTNIHENIQGKEGVVIPQLSQATLSFLLDPNAAILEEEMSAVTKTHGVKKGVVKEICKLLIVTWQNAMRECWDDKRLQQLAVSCGLAEDLSKTLSKHWMKCSKLMTSGISGNKNIEGKDVVDMDWSFGVTAASSDNSEVGSPYLQMRLTIRDKGTEETQTVFLELTLEQFYHFLAQLEACKTAIDILSSNA